jgi:CubicO group peptidase (beta-lactamase class C family)
VIWYCRDNIQSFTGLKGSNPSSQLGDCLDHFTIIMASKKRGIVRKSFLTTGLLLWASTIAISSAPAQPAVDPVVEAKIQNIVNNIAPAVVIKGQGGSHVTLASRMVALHVPGVSIAVIHEGKIEWARVFGATNTGCQAQYRIQPTTLSASSAIMLS